MVQPVILVVGPTASGKSALAAQLAARLGGEVISADAMAVYRGLEVGTAKPGPAELALAPHHLISVVEPDDRCDVARWLGLAEAVLRDLRSRDRVAVVAGGSPLYSKALVEGLTAGAPRDAAVRDRLNAAFEQDRAALWLELQQLDPVYAAGRHPNDQRRIVRALEVIRLTGKPYSSFHTSDGVRRSDLRTLHLGLHWPKAILHHRIAQRCAGMFQAGLVAEVAGLRGRLSPEASQAVGYKEVLNHLAGHCDLATAQQQVELASRHLAKHQLTWYRGMADLVWLPGDAADLADRAEALARRFLAGGEILPDDPLSVRPPAPEPPPARRAGRAGQRDGAARPS
ncbi:tRNA dimethylallyltransferase [Planctomycetota bacterium]|nr:tRNA dimethylallyltransferase [Planctomycetota bacterium]